MTIEALIAEVYAAFNRRDIDGVFEWMTESVDWPKASEGGRAVGKDEIRAYWTRQWQEYDPRVEPLGLSQSADGRVTVRVHQVVKNLAGDVLLDHEVRHVYTLADGLISRMDIEDSDTATFPRP